MAINETIKDIKTVLKSRYELIKAIENYRQYFMYEVIEARNFEILMKTYPRLTYADFEGVIVHQGFKIVSNTNMAITVSFSDEDKRLVKLASDIFAAMVGNIKNAIANGEDHITIGYFEKEEQEYLVRTFKIKGFHLVQDETDPKVLLLNLDPEEIAGDKPLSTEEVESEAE